MLILKSTLFIYVKSRGLRIRILFHVKILVKWKSQVKRAIAVIVDNIGHVYFQYIGLHFIEDNTLLVKALNDFPDWHLPLDKVQMSHNGIDDVLI